MQRRRFSLLVIGASLGGCASREPSEFRVAAASRSTVVVQDPEWVVTMPMEYPHRKLFTNEIEKSYSAEEMASWSIYFQKNYGAKQIRERFRFLLTQMLIGRGYLHVVFVDQQDSQQKINPSDVIDLQFEKLTFSGIAFGMNKGKRMILTVSGQRVTKAGSERQGDLYTTHISPIWNDMPKGFIKPSEMDRGGEFAEQRLDEALSYWLGWALSPLHRS